ncbi:tetratricopeptide repeat protein [Streptomyces sp. NPDC015127]|uniref:tetratricopeptide repeat protein n=1 Tax=Streptomyces sp. NPDC015127 TaxID=3364939 RepID=UPI0036FA744A
MGQAEVARASAELQQGHALLREARANEALAVSREVVGVLTRELGEDSPDVANALLLRGEAYRMLGCGRDSMRDLLRAVAITRPLRSVGPCDRLHGQALRAVADGMWRAGRYRVAEVWLRHTLRFVEDRLADRLEAARVRNVLGVVLRYDGRHSAAEQQLRHALQETCRPGGERLAATVHHNLAGLRLAQGALEDAEHHARRALELRHDAKASSVLAVAADQLCLAGVLSARGQGEQALMLAQTALQTYRDRLGDEHVEIGYCLHVLAHAQAIEGHRQAAAELYRKAIAVKTGALGAHHPELANSWRGLASVADGNERITALSRAQSLCEHY